MTNHNNVATGGAYIRYSSLMQSDGFSLQAQERQIREQAHKDGVELVGLYSDPATSAYRRKFRPGISEMLEDAKLHRFNVVYVHKVDRLARNLGLALEVVKILQDHNIALKAVEQNFDLRTPEGKLIFAFLASLGEFYSDNLSKETHKGKIERSREGFHNGIVPWGFDSVLIDGKKRAVPVAELVPVVQQVFEKYSTGSYSDAQIAEWLNSLGHRTRRGRIFSKDTIREILQNAFYTGIVKYRGARESKLGAAYRTLPGEENNGLHKPMISSDLFEHCQKVRVQRQVKEKTRQHTKHVYLLNGLVVCSACGRHLRAQSAVNGTLYYREVSKERGFDDCNLERKSIKAKEIDDQVASIVKRLILPLNWEQAVRKSVEVSKMSFHNPDNEKEKIRAELRRLREGYELGLYDDDPHVFQAKVKSLKEKLAAIESTSTNNDVKNAANIIISMQSTWELATSEERRTMVQMVFSQVACDVMKGRIIWFKVKKGFEALFEFYPGIVRSDEGKMFLSAGV